MKKLQVELPDQMAQEIEGAVETGKFESAAEVARAALREFISRRRFELLEQQQLKDIAWALNVERDRRDAGPTASASSSWRGEPTRGRACAEKRARECRH
jgi:Arc/MetJ-type ribon-helix-helix transcriptional regulator